MNKYAMINRETNIVVHNCRSTLIPITKYEEYEPDTHVGKTPIQEFIEKNIGKGFATK